jgi:hypothetical protein
MNWPTAVQGLPVSRLTDFKAESLPGMWWVSRVFSDPRLYVGSRQRGQTDETIRSYCNPNLSNESSVISLFMKHLYHRSASGRPV